MKYMSNLLSVILLTMSLSLISMQKSNIETAVGKTFDIVLPENVTTGYSWYWLVCDGVSKRSLELVKKEAVAQEPHMIGSGSSVRFTFKAMRVGTATIVFTLKRIWEQNSDADQKRFDVIIHAKQRLKTKK